VILRRFLLLLPFCLPGFRAWATDYYVSPSGLDTNPGSLASPWKTAAPVNAATFGPGDHIYFESGQTFTAKVNLSAADSGSSGNPVIVGSYGAGRATISVAGQSAFNIQDTQYIELQDLILKGNGGGGARGISLRDNGSGNLQHFWMRNCEVYGFGDSGLYITAGLSTGGYHNVSVTACDFHNNIGCGVSCDGTYWDTTPRPNGNFYFAGCRFYSNIASGLMLVETSGALVEHCEAFLNGPSSGCIGFWCWDSDHIVFQYCESHHNKRTATGSDGGGFDLDGATDHSAMQYCYSHDNDGGGFALYQFAWAELSGPMSNNIIRYNVSENDGRKGGYGGLSFYGDGNYSGQPAPGDWIDYTEIYNNTVYTSSPASAAVEFISYFAKNILFYNNIFYNSNVATFVHRDGDDGSIVFRNNVYWRPGGTFRMDWDGTIFNSFASWRGYGPGKQEMEGAVPRGYNADPLLTSPGTGGTVMPAPLSSLSAYQLQTGSPLRDTGLDMATRLILTPAPGPQDYYGNSIPKGAGYEIGAHELPPVPTATVTPSQTANGTFTTTPTISPTHTISPTFTATPAAPQPQGQFVMSQQLPVPNPQAGPLFSFSMQLTRPATRVTLSLYSPGMTLVRRAEAMPQAWSGWQRASFMLPGLSNGLYYYSLEAEDSLGRGIKSNFGKLFILQ
jgi:hypothetical protein